jgi:nitrogen fixation/metabolism regulation signal transduction histidine kinase
MKSPSQSQSEPESVTPSRYHRSLRNYLLEPAFQLKYANGAAAVVVLLSIGLGTLLWRTSQEMLRQSSAAVQLGEETLAESRKVTEVVAMSIARDPVYGANPALKEAFEGDAEEQNKTHLEKQERLKAQAAALETQSMRFTQVLVAALVLLVAALWFGAIVLTHRIAGPAYKMRRQLRAVSKGDWSRPSPLRKRDELRSFFAAFEGLVDALRQQRREHIKALDEVLTDLPDGISKQQLLALRQTMARPLSPDSERP